MEGVWGCGAGDEELSWQASPLDTSTCLDIDIKLHERYSVQPVCGHELHFFVRFGILTTLTLGNAVIFSNSLFWLDTISFTYCLLVLLQILFYP